MGSVRKLTAGLILGLALGSTAWAADLSGDWLIEAGDTKIRVSRCGPALCGEIVWLKEPIDKATGKPQTDDRNSDPAKQQRSIIGLRIFEMSTAGADTWSGPLYNTDDGNTYEGAIVLQGPAKLEVKACAGTNCGVEIWTLAQ